MTPNITKPARFAGRAPARPLPRVPAPRAACRGTLRTYRSRSPAPERLPHNTRGTAMPDRELPFWRPSACLPRGCALPRAALLPHNLTAPHQLQHDRIDNRPIHRLIAARAHFIRDLDVAEGFPGRENLAD